MLIEKLIGDNTGATTSFANIIGRNVLFRVRPPLLWISRRLLRDGSVSIVWKILGFVSMITVNLETEMEFMILTVAAVLDYPRCLREWGR